MGIYYCNSDKYVMFECDTIRCPIEVGSWRSVPTTDMIATQ